MKPGSKAHVRFWEAVNEYAAACGGDTSGATVGNRRMDAVARVERSLRVVAIKVIDCPGCGGHGVNPATDRRCTVCGGSGAVSTRYYPSPTPGSR